MKTCTKCKVEKAFTEFHKKASSIDGHENRCKECRRIIYENNKDEAKAQQKTYYYANREKVLALSKVWYEANKEKEAARRKAHRKANREKLLAQNKAWREANKKRLNAKYCKKFKTNSHFKMTHTLRARIRLALKAQGTCRSQSSLELLGSSVAFARKWIESQFLPGMTWENHGEWHIDHIKPCAAFDLRDPNQQRECFNYKNLQPLWAADNISKRDRF